MSISDSFGLRKIDTRRVAQKLLLQRTLLKLFLVATYLVLMSGQSFACDVDAWSSSDGTLVVEADAAARYMDLCGLRADLTGAGNGWLVDATPGALTPAVTEYSARFYIYVDDAIINIDEALVIFTGEDAANNTLFGLEFVNKGSGPAFHLYVIDDNGGRRDALADLPVAHGWRAIHLDWIAGNSSSGFASLGMDELISLQFIENVDNGSQVLDHIKLGAVSGNTTGTRGVIDMDSFASQRWGDNGVINKGCSGDIVNVENTTFLPGLYVCNATESIGFGARVVFDPASQVEVNSITSELLPGTRISNGAVLMIR